MNIKKYILRGFLYGAQMDIKNYTLKVFWYSSKSVT